MLNSCHTSGSQLLACHYGAHAQSARDCWWKNGHQCMLYVSASVFSCHSFYQCCILYITITTTTFIIIIIRCSQYTYYTPLILLQILKYLIFSVCYIHDKLSFIVREFTTQWMGKEHTAFLFFSCDIVEVSNSRMIRWAGHVVQTGEVRNAYMIVCSRNRYEWVSDIKMYLGLGLWEYTLVTANIMRGIGTYKHI